MPYKGFANQEYVISAADLQGRLDEVLLIDVRPAEAYAAGHIEGTTHFDLYGISLNDTSPEPLEAFMSMINHQFEFRGVIYDTPVVIYDDESGERAARGVWLLAVLQHPNTRLLDGGVQAWTDAGNELTTVTAPPTRTTYSGRTKLRPSGDQIRRPSGAQRRQLRSRGPFGATRKFLAPRNVPGALVRCQEPSPFPGVTISMKKVHFDRRTRSETYTPPMA